MQMYLASASFIHLLACVFQSLSLVTTWQTSISVVSSGATYVLSSQNELKVRVAVKETELLRPGDDLSPQDLG